MRQSYHPGQPGDAREFDYNRRGASAAHCLLAVVQAQGLEDSEVFFEVLTPLQIEFQNTRPIEPVEFRIRRELAELEKFYHRLVSCRVEVELPKHERRGSVSKVRIDFGVPAEDAATPAGVRGAPAKQDTDHVRVDAQHKDPVMAVHAAFNIARRRLEDFAAR